MAGINIADKIKGSPVSSAAISISSSSSSINLDAGDKLKLLFFILGLAAIYFMPKYIESLVQEKEAVLRTQSAELDTEIAKRTQRVKELQSVKEEADRYDQVTAEIQRKLRLAESVGRDRNFLVRAVDFVIQQMPSKVWMKSISLDLTTEKKLAIEGASLQMQTVSDFMFQLQPGSFFSNWELEETQIQVNAATDANPKAPAEYKNFRIRAVVVEP